MKLFPYFVSAILLGCAHQQLNAPSGAAVATGIQQTKQNITTAQHQNTEIGSSNAQQKTLAQRIHDKDVLIDRWNETHKGQ